jgi:hypothetical protein
MAFRTHVGRRLNLTLGSNRLILGLTAVTAIAALAVMITSDIAEVWVAPFHVFLTWALVREIDPDHDWTALAAAFFAGLWVIVGEGTVSVMALLGLMMAARLVLNSTGRRPLNTDLIGLVLLGSAVAFTPAGWVAGFGLAVAIYIDDRLSPEPRTRAVLAAALAAMGASAVATLTSALPETLPDIRPLLTVVIGIVALAGIMREPVEPLSVTDSRDRRLLEPRRLHAARGLVGIVLFLSALLNGPEAVGLVPAFLGYALALFTEGLDRLQRRHS